MNIDEECHSAYGAGYVSDGILNPELYQKARLKILWLLREAWNKEAIDWVREEGVYKQTTSSPTLQPMAYVTFSVLAGNYDLWEKMGWLRENHHMSETLRSVAYINVKKVPGETISDLGVIKSYFEKGQNILKAQLAECKPDVVIGCKPYMEDIFRWDGSRSPPKEHEIIRYVADRGKPLLIEAPHPSQRKIRRQVYVDTLIQIIQRHEAWLPTRF